MSAPAACVPPSVRRRIERELRTVRVMIGMYCRHHHGADLCPACAELWEYAEQRVDRCPFRTDKPTCLNCPVHCYKPAMRERIRVVMRFAGPRMMLRHPILALFHLVDGRRSESAAGPAPGRGASGS